LHNKNSIIFVSNYLSNIILKMFNLTKKNTIIFFCLLISIFFSAKIFFYILAKENKDSSIRMKYLSEQLRCPTCQGLSVNDSEAGFSRIFKVKIIELIKKGKSDKEIIKYFVQRYGEWILRSPTKDGFNLVLWALPGIGIFFGLFWVFFRFKISSNHNKGEKLKELTPEEEKKVIEDFRIFRED